MADIGLGINDLEELLKLLHNDIIEKLKKNQEKMNIINQLRKIWRCKVRKQHFFVQVGHEIGEENNIKIRWKCVFCGDEAYQLIPVTYDPVKKRGEVIRHD